MLSVGSGVLKQAATRWAESARGWRFRPETARGESGRYDCWTHGKRLSGECGTKSKMPGVVGVLGQVSLGVPWLGSFLVCNQWGGRHLGILCKRH